MALHKAENVSEGLRKYFTGSTVLRSLRSVTICFVARTQYNINITRDINIGWVMKKKISLLFGK